MADRADRVKPDKVKPDKVKLHRIRDLNLLTPMKVCIHVWEGSDGLWRWANDWEGAAISEGFATHQLAVDAVMNYGGTRHWWPQILDVADPAAG